MTMSANDRIPAPAESGGRMPRQIPYIIGNEACERFSFYGMRNILTPFLTTALLLYMPEELARKAYAKDIFHTFVIGVYFFPLLGGWLADRLGGSPGLGGPGLGGPGRQLVAHDVPAIFHHSSVRDLKIHPTIAADATAEMHASVNEMSSERARLSHFFTSQL